MWKARCLSFCTTVPYHQFIVMNRRSADNYVEDIASPKFQIQESDPYLMYRAPTNQIIGLWFSDAEERVALVKLLRSITKSYADKAAQVTALLGSVPSTSGASVRPQLPTGAISAAELEAKQLGASAAAASSGPASNATINAIMQHAASTVAAAAAAPAATAPLSKAQLREHLLRLANNDDFLEAVLKHYQS
eukprot:TRINITY_DN7567_c0_g1_i1.p1 TRINITY_DN7567_c0_g1~~TRINITY_DN7567_c0_g1_i1.p1  ORF type:complete len:192 (-),score=9.25 TRINITY_DN7567_c0_g1_i1:12-587(-)